MRYVVDLLDPCQGPVFVLVTVGEIVLAVQGAPQVRRYEHELNKNRTRLPSKEMLHVTNEKVNHHTNLV